MEIEAKYRDNFGIEDERKYTYATVPLELKRGAALVVVETETEGTFQVSESKVVDGSIVLTPKYKTLDPYRVIEENEKTLVIFNNGKIKWNY